MGRKQLGIMFIGIFTIIFEHCWSWQAHQQNIIVRQKLFTNSVQMHKSKTRTGKLMHTRKFCPANSIVQQFFEFRKIYNTTYFTTDTHTSTHSGKHPTFHSTESPTYRNKFQDLCTTKLCTLFLSLTSILP